MFRFVTLLALVWFAALPGCAPRQEDVEKAVRAEMSARLETAVDSLKLETQPGGGYSGTATVGGDTFDVVVDPPRGGRVQWRLFPSQATVERVVTDGLQNRHQLRVTALDLKKEESGNFTGTAALEDGTKLRVEAKLTGRRIVWEAEPAL